MRKLLNVSLLAFVLSGCFESEHGPYVRIHSGNFQVASKSFVPENGNGPKVTLLGVIHVGEKNYYHAIQERLNRADRVLFEEAGRGEEVTELRNEVEANCPANLSLFPKDNEPGGYAKLADALHLVEQVTVIDYKKPHFVQADATLRQLLTRNHPQGTPLCTILDTNKERSKQAIETEDPSYEAMKKLGKDTTRNGMALMLSKLITKDRTQSEKDGDKFNQFIIFERNDIAFDVLRKEIPRHSSGREIVVFYGAAHLDDLEKSLKGLGYQLDSTEWLSAFAL